MQIINKTINNIPVKIIKTDKFKSTIISVVFKNLVSKENITSYSLLRGILCYSTKKYNTNDKLSLKLVDNYNSYLYGSTNRIGKCVVNSFYIETLDDKYTEKGNLNSVIDLLFEVLFNPNVKDNKFDKSSFDICYKDFELSLKKVEENNGSLASRNVYNYMNQKKEYTYLKTLDQLKSINEENLYKSYNKMINESDAKIFICGNVDENIDITKIASNLNNKNRYNMDFYIDNNDINEEYKVIKESNKGNESIHYLVGYLKGLTDYEKNYVVPIYRYILGSTGNSRLFNTVREKNSLAYYSFARYEKTDNMIFIITGCEKDNYDKLNEIINKEIKKMDKITNRELLNAKKQIISSLLESTDNMLQIVKRNMYEELFELPDINGYIKVLNSVTKDDVINISKKAHYKLNYFLGGASDE